MYRENKFVDWLGKTQSKVVENTWNNYTSHDLVEGQYAPSDLNSGQVGKKFVLRTFEGNIIGRRVSEGSPKKGSFWWWKRTFEDGIRDKKRST